MARRRRLYPVTGIVIGLLVVLVTLQVQQVSGLYTDAQCLVDFKSSVSDPQNALSNWVAANITKDDDICLWRGVECFLYKSVPVYQLILTDVGLSGTWPNGLSLCKSLQTLDLSQNSFTGPIPNSIATDIPNLVSLNLEYNSLGGSIPAEFGNCKYLNTLILNNNRLSGEIPAQIGLLPRLSTFNVSNNQLSGVIPSTFVKDSLNGTGFSASCFEGNTYLCGAPLTGSCKSRNGKSSMAAIIGGAVGGVFGLVVLAGLLLWCFIRRSQPAKGKFRKGGRGVRGSDRRWAHKVLIPRGITVSMFENPIVRIRFTDLMEATNDFSNDNIISTSRTGTMYRAEFPDGSVMAIKRLQVSSHNDRAFQAEMETLGHLRHLNLVPLLGYCVAGGERLLIYKHMPHGTVWEQLHPSSGKPSFDWSERVRVATGGARGLGWLHHTCNPRVIHRNISSKSILLDDDNEPRITDFGLARLMNPVETHVSTFVNGDYGDVGYVAPEYIRTLVATTKGDVFSFGVVLLELVTGQKPVDVLPATGSFKGNLVEYVTMLSAGAKMLDAVDPSLTGNGVDDEILQVFKVAISCVSAESKDRPTMFEVYQLLRDIGQKYDFTDQFDDLPTLADHGGDEVDVIVK